MPIDHLVNTPPEKVENPDMSKDPVTVYKAGPPPSPPEVTHLTGRCKQKIRFTTSIRILSHRESPVDHTNRLLGYD